jgi:hypothetical protein
MEAIGVAAHESLVVEDSPAGESDAGPGEEFFL